VRLLHNSEIKGVLQSIIISGLLLGCGGGGGGSSSSGPVASPSAFSMATVRAYRTINGASLLNKSLSGTLNYNGSSYAISGTLSFTVSPPTTTTFDSQTALENTVTETGSITVSVNGQSSTVPVASTAHGYSTTNYSPLGMTSATEYDVFQGTANIPSSVKVGDTGVIGTYNLYTDSSMTTLKGTMQESYVVEADTANSVIIDAILNTYDTGNTLISTVQERWRIDTSNTVTFVSLTDGTAITSGSLSGGYVSFTVQ
jgi:hypothetical protein